MRVPTNRLALRKARQAAGWRGNGAELNWALSQERPCKARFSRAGLGSDPAPQLAPCCPRRARGAPTGTPGWAREANREE